MYSGQLAQDVYDALVSSAIEVGGSRHVLIFSRGQKILGTDATPDLKWAVDVVEIKLTKEQEASFADFSSLIGLLLPVTEYVPELGDTSLVRGRMHLIKQIKEISPFGQAVAYKILIGA